MDLSTSDLLIGLGFIASATCIATAAYARLRAGGRAVRRPAASPARPPHRAAPVARLYRSAQPALVSDPEDQPSPGQSGRHFVPDELLYSKTYKLGPAQRVRAQSPR
ncbi:hypothetical protein [Krasilnikovia sp. MM14-A1259]|uniref:hypothetical protein n=1 Tax=Krasilnikovia sp. MM14-A1259 TaxID=3373539 RepID=UPI0037FCC0F4